MRDSVLNNGIAEDKRYYLAKALLLPAMALLALTGCSTLSGSQPAKTTQAYLEQSSNLPEDINGDDDPDYEWFY
ncbi:MAG TPA: hypothetical protein VE641_21670 [Chthoniobacterales bacterium]|jgi:uncharacterized lipoprotein YajG|nr:hypothetical protein [Chthoniobacterales bacterium]